MQYSAERHLKRIQINCILEEFIEEFLWWYQDETFEKCVEFLCLEIECGCKGRERVSSLQKIYEQWQEGRETQYVKSKCSRILSVKILEDFERQI